MAGRKVSNAAHPLDEVIRERYLTTPVKRLAIEIGKSHCYVVGRMRKLGLIVPPDIIEARKQASRIKAGSVPQNKGKKLRDYTSPEVVEKILQSAFKKGHKPHNTKADGVITVRPDKTGRPYKYIRISEGKWELLHRHIWQQHFGAIPEGALVSFKNGDPLNCSIDNLELISRKENMLRQSAQLRLTDGYVLNAIAGYRHRSSKEFKAAIKQQRPELIELKRTQLLLTRRLKTTNDVEQTNEGCA